MSHTMKVDYPDAELIIHYNGDWSGDVEMNVCNRYSKQTLQYFVPGWIIRAILSRKATLAIELMEGAIEELGKAVIFE